MKNRSHKAPRYSELFSDVVKVIAEAGGSASIEEILEGVISLRKFPDDVVDELHTGSTTTTELEYQLAWTRTYLKKSGLILRSKNGVWALTREGYEAYKTRRIDSANIVKSVRASVRKSDKSLRQSENPLEVEERRPWKERLAEILHSMNPYSFEVLAQRLLRECGFADVCVTKKSGDGGIDGTGKLRLNGIFSFNVAFQCKRYKGQVGSGEIRDFRGSLDNNIEKGVLITTGSFSKAAREEACAPGKKQIDLMDGNDFMDKLAEHSIGLNPRMEYDIDDDYFAAIEVEGQG
ncbi:MAG: restriction endonuclease [Kiritimatiellae bacterium]|nr:restriction endonuclease [Kiritimatiellia bacterium]